MACPFAAIVWSSIWAWCGLGFTGISSTRELLDIPGSINMASDKRWILTSIVRATAWFIWRTRNDFIFDSVSLSVSSVVDRVIVSVYSWMRFRAKKSKIVWQNWCNASL